MLIANARPWLLAAALAFIAAPARAHEPFAGGGMVSITFDDSLLTQYEIARPALNARGVRGTYYLITMDLVEDGYITSALARTLAAEGHEVGSHTRVHPHLVAMSDADLALELTLSRDDLTAATGVVPQSLGFPFGEYDDRVIAATAQVYGSSRTVDAHLNYRDTSHFHLGAHSCTLDLATIQGLVDTAQAQSAWLILYLHDVTRNEPTGSTCSLDKLEAVLDYVQLKGLPVVTVSQGVELMNLTPAPTPTLSSDWHYAWVKPEEVVVKGGRYARRITEVAAASNVYHTVDSQSADRVEQPWEISTIARADTRSALFLQLGDGATVTSAGFDLATGTVKWLSPADRRAAADIEPLGDGWYRCSFVVDSIRAVNAVIGLVDATGRAAYPGDASAGLYLATATVSPAAALPVPVIGSDWRYTAGATLDVTTQVFGRAAQRLVEDTSTGYHDVVNHSTTRPTGTWEISTVVHAEARSGIFIQTNSGGPPYRNAGFDLAAGRVLWNDSGIPGVYDTTATIEALGDGWYRCRFVVNTPFKPVEAIIGLLKGSSASYTGDGVSGVYLAEALVTQLGVPTLASVTPSTGPTAGGTSVTVSGTQFVAGSRLFFGGIEVTPAAITATSISATTPAHEAGAVAVRVENPDSAAAELPAAFTYVAPAPTVTGITPTSGPVSGGTTVSIAGADFQPGASVAFGGVAAGSVTVASAGEILAVTAPSTGPATVAVTVTNPDGQTASWTGFTYELGPAPTVAGVSPSSGSTAGGTVLTISGSGFQIGATVLVGGLDAPASWTSSEQLTCTTPPHATGVVSVTVRNPDGQQATLASAYTYTAPGPTITAVTPAAGSILGGTPVAISGTGFKRGCSVRFGSVTATDVRCVAETVRVTTPPGATVGAVDVVVTNPDAQSATAAGAFTYLPAPPANLAARTEAGGIALSWSVAAGASSYEVLRSQTATGAFSVAGYSATPSYLDAEVAPGVWYYAVRSIAAAGASEPSNVVSASTVLAAPTGLIATAGARRVVLEWNTVPGATSYTLLRSTTTGGPYAQVSSTTATSYTDQKVKAGTTYYYVVRARNALTEGPLSTEVSAKP